MNILYLHSHDTGRCIQPYGFPVATPNLQRLAEEGTLFRDAHCGAPTCSPSRAALLTGESAHGAGMVGLAHRGSRLRHPERHLAAFLKERGYLTRRSGIAHVGGDEAAQGYLGVGEGDHRDGATIVRDAVAFLEARDGSRPFFLDAGFLETHRTEWVSNGFNQDRHDPKDGDGNPGYVQPPAILPDTESTRRDWLDFRHSVERLDAYYGTILDALDRTGLADDTLVLATTDHGIAFPGLKCNLTHHGTGVLQILRFPKGLGGGLVSDALVSHLDFFPTVCDLLAAERPAWLEGRSLLPLVRGETEVVRDDLAAEVTFHAAFEPKRSIRSKRWNYIRNFGPPRTQVMPNCDDGHSKRHLMAHGLAERPVPPEELYDLVFDPLERHNLLEGAGAGDPAHAETLADFRQRLVDWMHETDDPLLHEEAASVLPLPQKVNTHDQPHPGPGSVEWDPGEWPGGRIG